MNKWRVVEILMFVPVAIVAYMIGRGAVNENPAKDTPVLSEENPVRQTREEGYEFISPLVECDCYKPSRALNAVLLEDELNGFIDGAKGSGRASHISVYFRDLNNGPWIGINESETFIGASLYKVPLMIAALKIAEKNPSLLKKRLTYTQEAEDPAYQVISDSAKLIPGRSYDFEYLLFRMIVYSDNNAKNMVMAEVGSSYFIKVLDDIQNKVGGSRSPGNLVTVKEFSSFFRVLYNASYLNKEMSEKALSMMTNCTFHDGLVAGLPAGVKVAHKFGENGYSEEGGVQLHDCGIVYAGKRPYLLCVMTRGSSSEELPKIIADISRLVYNGVSNKAI